MEGHSRRQDQTRRVEGVASAGAHIAAFVPVGMIVPMLRLTGGMAVAVVSPLVHPAVEEIGAQEPRQNPAQQGHHAALLQGVGHQVKADHAEHHPGGEAQEQAHCPVGGAVDRRRKAAAQGQAPHAGDGSDQKDRQIDVFHRCHS